MTSSTRVLWVCAGFACVVEGVLLGLVFGHFTLFSHTATLQNSYLEARLYEPDVPDKIPQLRSPKPMFHTRSEPTVSTTPLQSTPTPVSTSPAAPKQNRVSESVAPVKPATHGPIVLVSPSPIIPVYLRDKPFKSSVVIEFSVSEDGSAHPRLLGSSDNEELDQIALKAAKKWQFDPAVKDNKPLASKIRLRIMFEVL